MLYFPWYSESTDLLGGYSTYEEHYNHVKHIVDSLEIDENNFLEHVWNQIAPNTESSRAQSLAEGIEPLTEISQEDLDHHTNLFTSTTHGSLHARFESAANKQQIPADEYRTLLRGLTAKQRQIASHVPS